MLAMLIGAHISTEGGLHTALDRAVEEGCDALQIFTKNKGTWAAKPLTDEQLQAFQDRARATGHKPVVAHAAYLINLASPAKELRDKSTEALRVEVERCEALGISSLVLHPGSHGGTSDEEGLRRAATALDRVHRATRGFRTRILLETSAGQGSSICVSFASIGNLIDRVRDPERLGVCVDTCHIFAAGYELRTDEGYHRSMAELEEHVGSSRVLCLHINDSKKELGTRVDRHEHIGKGYLGSEGLRRILNDSRFAHAPFIFELPPENGMIRKNLAALRALVVRPRKTRSLT